MNNRPHVVLVGGFLGAGKTSLILSAARILERRGVRTAVVLNDQGESLVDAAMARQRGLAADQVARGCFCCRYSDLIDALERVENFEPGVIFAEPVGSCTDIAATVIRPLLRDCARYRVAPFTVLVDPGRTPAGEAQRFLYDHQLAEADIIAWTKSDLYPDDGRPGRRMSAQTGRGVEAWIDEVLSGDHRAGARVIDVNYDQYAAAESALAWLNCEARFDCEPPLTPAMFVGPLFERMDAALTDANVGIVHLKLLDRTPMGFIKAAICCNREEPAVEGDFDASPSRIHELLINLRAAGDPQVVRSVVESHLAAMAHEIRLDCFRPAPPVAQTRA